MLRRLLGLRARRRRELELEHIDNQKLDAMYEDDTIDIKNFSNMPRGRAKDELRAILSERRKWYNKIGLLDWAEQIDIALWLDEKNERERDEAMFGDLPEKEF